MLFTVMCVCVCARVCVCVYSCLLDTFIVYHGILCVTFHEIELRAYVFVFCFFPFGVWHVAG